MQYFNNAVIFLVGAVQFLNEFIKVLELLHSGPDDGTIWDLHATPELHQKWKGCKSRICRKCDLL